jgi:2,4-dienoyl-CoA reductase-like NADH-dependent reductase (Old Yellow Enzyme family)
MPPNPSPSPPLFLTPLRLPCGLVLRNRIVRAAAFAGGTVEEQARTHAEVARGGAALTTVAYTSVSGDGRTFASQLLLTPEGAPPTLATIARAVHAEGALLSFQLTHAGGFADKGLVLLPRGGSAASSFPSSPSPSSSPRPAPPDTDPTPIGPAAVFDVALLGWPRKASDADMDRLARDFAAAAALAVTAGEADAVEVHLGHGYLLSQWLSPKLNTRTDEHGGPIANRLRFPLRVVRAVRAAIGPRKALFVKLNVDDGFAGGVSPEDVDAVVEALCGAEGVAGGTQQGDGDDDSIDKGGDREADPLPGPRRRLIDGLIPSAGFVSKNGFFMLRGAVPRAGMVRALGRTSGLKAGALALLGRWLVPEIPFSPRFLLDAQRRVLATVRRGGWEDVPVLAIGGFVSLPDVEGALAEGFGGVQMARALIREPDLVRRWEESCARGDGGRAEASRCSHCNICVLAALTPEVPARCVERGPEGGEEGGKTAGGKAPPAGGVNLLRDIEEAGAAVPR